MGILKEGNYIRIKIEKACKLKAKNIKVTFYIENKTSL